VSAAPLLDRLTGVRKAGDGRWMAKCPAHEDRRSSLSIRELPDGRVLLHDFAGCETAAVLGVLGLAVADLFPERLTNAAPVRDRAHWHAQRAAFDAICDEINVIAIAAGDLAVGRPLSARDTERLSYATARVREARRVLYGR
jgi:hypothetical protein